MLGSKTLNLSFVAVRSLQIERLKKSIDGVYEFDDVNGAQPFYNETSGHWEISTFDFKGIGQYRAYLAHFRTLEDPSSQYVVRDYIDRASWEESGEIVPYNVYVDDGDAAPSPDGDQDEGSRIPESSETICLWSLGGSDMASVFLRCANTVRSRRFTSHDFPNGENVSNWLDAWHL